MPNVWPKKHVINCRMVSNVSFAHYVTVLNIHNYVNLNHTSKNAVRYSNAAYAIKLTNRSVRSNRTLNENIPKFLDQNGIVWSISDIQIICCRNHWTFHSIQNRKKHIMLECNVNNWFIRIWFWTSIKTFRYTIVLELPFPYRSHSTDVSNSFFNRKLRRATFKIPIINNFRSYSNKFAQNKVRHHIKTASSSTMPQT